VSLLACTGEQRYERRLDSFVIRLLEQRDTNSVDTLYDDLKRILLMAP